MNFQALMAYVLLGVMEVYKKVPFQDAVNPDKIAGQVSLWHLLYNYMFMSDGHCLFVEIHWRSPILDVKVIIPNMPKTNKTCWREITRTHWPFSSTICNNIMYQWSY